MTRFAATRGRFPAGIIRQALLHGWHAMCAQRCPKLRKPVAIAAAAAATAAAAAVITTATAAATAAAAAASSYPHVSCHASVRAALHDGDDVAAQPTLTRRRLVN